MVPDLYFCVYIAAYEIKHVLQSMDPADRTGNIFFNYMQSEVLNFGIKYFNNLIGSIPPLGCNSNTSSQWLVG